MSYTVIENFLGGVDRTRPIYATPPGSLWQGINGHLSRGGDFEKRKSFVTYASVPGNTYSLAQNGSTLYTFGSDAAPSMPPGVVYQRLQHPDGFSMTGVTTVELVSGKLYVVAKFSDGSYLHFYDGQVVSDMTNGVVRAGMVDNGGIAAHLAALIDADPAYTATAAGNVITITATNIGTPFTIDKFVENVPGGVNDQSITLAQVQPNIPGIAEVLATGGFKITGGTASAGVNKVSSVRVNGVEILNVAVDWITSHSGTATNVAAQINAFASTPEYTATSDGQTVIIHADTGSGATPNGYSVEVTVGGNVTVGNQVPMAGGVTAVAGQAQVWTATIGGTFEVGDRFTITIDNKKFGAEAQPAQVGHWAKAHGRKMYTGDELLNFSGVDDPTGWNRDDDAGAGFINLSAEDSLSAHLTGAGKYINFLAIFAEQAIQIWDMQPDDANNQLQQTIDSTGTISPKSIINFGDLDLFYLSPSGVRSIRARTGQNVAGVDDVGTPIDVLVKVQMAAMSTAQIEMIPATYDPDDGRLWIAVGDKVFVFSYFKNKRVSGWSWYEPGFSITDFAVLKRRVYARAGNTIYLYGGPTNDAFGAEYLVTCWPPFFTLNKPGTYKGLTAVDVAAEGAWLFRVLINPRDLNEFVDFGAIDGFTFDLDEDHGLGEATHFSPKLTHQAEGYASISMAAHYWVGPSSEA